VPRERDRRQAQAGGPSFGASAQGRGALVGESDTGDAQQFARLALAESKLARPDFPDLAVEAQAMQPKPRVASRGEDRVGGGGEVREQPLELGERLGAAQLVEVVDDQCDGLSRLADADEHSIDRTLGLERRRFGGLLA
jgi:hypothetical protein